MVILIFIFLGLMFGSFVNALVWRLHKQEGLRSQISDLRNKKKNSAKKLIANDLSILKGRSMCPQCHHTLRASDLVPVLSWVGLRGKCRYCSKPISWQYPLVELLTAVLFVVSYWWWPFSFNAMGTFNFVVWCVVLVGFMALFIYDLKWMLLPDRITYPLIGLTALAAIINMTVFGSGYTGLSDTVIGVVVAAGLFYGLYQVSSGKWIGGGDAKLGLIIGLVIAVPLQSALVLFIASLLGTVVMLPGLVTKKLSGTSHIPFGPFLIVAALIVRLFGAGMIAWYRKKFLLL